MSTIKLKPFLKEIIRELLKKESRAPYAEPDATVYGMEKEPDPIKKVVV